MYLSEVVFRMVRRQPIAISLIHLGVTLLFVGGIFATSFASDHTIFFAADDIGKTKPLGDYGVKLSGFHVDQNQRGNWVQRATFELMDGKRILGSASSGYTRDRSGNYASRGIIRMPLSDVFVSSGAQG